MSVLRLVGASLIAAVGILVAAVPEAQARSLDPVVLERVVQENIAAIADHGARGGAKPIPQVSCDIRCADWWVQEHRPIPNQPSSQQLHRELRTLRSRGLGVLPKLRFAGAIGLAVGTFDVGWKIGTGFEAKLFRLGLPEPSDTTVENPRLEFVSAGHPLRTAYHVMPYDGWVWTWGRDNQVWFDYSRPLADKCQRYVVTPPADWGEILQTDNGDHCFRGWFEDPETAPIDAVSAIAPENSLAAVGPMEDYEDQPYGLETGSWWPDQPTTRTELETRTRSALESGEYPLLERWYAHLLEPENYPDPTTTEQEDHRCDLGDPTYENPGGNDAPPPHTTKSPTPFVASVKPIGAQDDPEPHLRFGAARWGGTALDHWSGWGWRHIAAKHGWSAADETATRGALAAPAATFEQSPTSMRYVGPEYEQNGVVCERWVIVEYRAQSNDPPATPKGIITSYGRFVRDAD